MRFLIGSVLLCIVTFSLHAQTDQGNQYSLQQALEYAYQHQPELLNAQLDSKIADSKVKEVIGIGLPQIGGSFDVKDFEKLPVSLIPAEFFGGKAGDFVGIEFGTRWNATASLTASQLVFNPAYLVGVQASKVVKELAQKNLQRARIETQVAVSKAYYNVLVNSERMKLLDANAARLKKLKDDTEAMYKNGFIEKIDVDRITLAYNNLNTEKEKTTRLMQLAIYLLKFQMGMSQNNEITLTDSLNSDAIKNIQVTEGRTDISNRIEYSILTTQQRVQALDLKRYKVAYLPTITAYGSVSANAFRSEFDIFDGDKKWYPTELIGATLSWTLFDGLQREHKIKQAQYSLEKVKNDLVRAENAFTFEAISAQTILQNALQTYKSQDENLALANEIVRVAKIKYDQGVGSNLEVVDAETSFREAQTNYYNAMFDVLVAKVDLDKALGSLK